MLQEQETHIVYDYSSKRVRVFTTRLGVYNGFIKRAGIENITIENDAPGLYQFSLDIDKCRPAQFIVKIAREDASEDTKEDDVSEIDNDVDELDEVLTTLAQVA